MSARRPRIKYESFSFNAVQVSFLNDAARWQSLSPREKEVARLIAEGYSDKEIARALQIGVRTVETHCSNIYDKLGTRSRVKVGIIASRFP
jgi:DNA-binding CsgD family transcriptional regulator